MVLASASLLCSFIVSTSLSIHLPTTRPLAPSLSPFPSRFLLMCVVLRCCSDGDSQSIFDLEEITLSAAGYDPKPTAIVDGQLVSVYSLLVVRSFVRRCQGRREERKGVPGRLLRAFLVGKLVG